MKLALLGSDAESLALAEAALVSGHELVWQGDLANADRAGRPWLAADQGEQWEDLLDRGLADGIIVGRGATDPELRLRQVQDLAKQGRAMLTTFPLFDSVLSYFEVDMARGEGGAVISYFNPLTHHRESAELARQISHGHPQLGRVEQVQCRRMLADRSQASVFRRFARDVDFLEWVAGAIDRIGAHGAAGNEAAYATLGVQLLGPAGLPIRWSVEPSEEREELRVVLVCERGRSTAVFDAAERPSIDTATSTFGGAPAGHASGVRVAEARTVDNFCEMIIAADANPAVRNGPTSWPAALHAMEIADSIEISLRRGRMIDIHSQQLTEHLAFKGTMAAAGCGVLLVIVPLMLVVGWIAGLFGIPVATYWPHALLAMLAVFLGLQILPSLLYRDTSADSKP